MGLDIDETRNHCITGIIPTDDDKYLFVEISQQERLERGYTLLSKKDYEKQFPYQKFIRMNFCFRVDIPHDYKENHTTEFSKYAQNHFPNYEYTKENIIKLLQEFNKNIDDIELTDDDYIDRFCEKKGFFKLYDDRLKHSYQPVEITWCRLEKEGEVRLKCIYTYWAANGTEYSKEQEMRMTMSEMIKNYGKEKSKELVDRYVEKKCEKFNRLEFQEEYKKAAIEIFEEKIINKEFDNHFGEKEIDFDY